MVNMFFIGYFLNEAFHCLIEKKWGWAALYSTVVILNIITVVIEFKSKGVNIY
jgi:hypothetical protein